MKYNKVSLFMCFFVGFLLCSASFAAVVKLGSGGVSGGTSGIGGMAKSNVVSTTTGIDDFDDEFADFDMTGMDEATVVAQLTQSIAEIDEQRKECEKQRKGWVVATAAGSAGVVATGVAALSQGQKIKDLKNGLDPEVLKNLTGKKEKGGGNLKETLGNVVKSGASKFITGQ